MKSQLFNNGLEGGSGSEILVGMIYSLLMAVMIVNAFLWSPVWYKLLFPFIFMLGLAIDCPKMSSTSFERFNVAIWQRVPIEQLVFDLMMPHKPYFVDDLHFVAIDTPSFIERNIWGLPLLVSVWGVISFHFTDVAQAKLLFNFLVAM